VVILSIILLVVLSILGLVIFNWAFRKRAEKIVPAEHLNSVRKGNSRGDIERQENDKLVIIEDVHFDNVTTIVGYICNLNNEEDFVVLPRLVKIKEKITAIYFPYDISFERFCYFINYFYFPHGLNFNYQPVVRGWTTTKSGDKWITGDLENRKIMVFCNPEDKEYDNVYFVTSDNLTYKCSFPIFKKHAKLASKILNYEQPGIDFNFLNKMQYEDFK